MSDMCNSTDAIASKMCTLRSDPPYFPESVKKTKSFFPNTRPFLSTFGKNYFFPPEITPVLKDSKRELKENYKRIIREL